MAAPFLQLGTVVLEVLAVRGLEATRGFDYASHDIVTGKPRLGFGGPQLEQLALELRLRKPWADPAAAIATLEAAGIAGDVLPLVYGNGHVRGRFVITNLSRQAVHTDQQGGLLDATVRLALTEYVESPPQLAPGKSAEAVTVKAHARPKRGTQASGRVSTAGAGRAPGAGASTVWRGQGPGASGTWPPPGDPHAVPPETIVRKPTNPLSTVSGF